jgi:methylaspartate ammonia-lyase
MKINDVVCSVGNSGYYNWDLAGLKAGAESDGFIYTGTPVTPGFEKLIQPGQCISIMLVLDSAEIAFGDCVDVILTGAAGRDPLFRADEHLPLITGPIREILIGRECGEFKEFATEIDAIKINGQRLHTAVRYGLTQALLNAAALAGRVTMAEIVSRDYDCQLSRKPIPLLSMCRTDDPQQVDKMILKRADQLPHADFIRVKEDLGPGAEKMATYLQWVTDRITQLGDSDYRPTLHLDVYGTLGECFNMDLGRIADFLARLENIANGLELCIEAPIIAPTQDAQVEAFLGLKAEIVKRGSRVRLILDEWVNTLEDVKKFADAKAADMIQVKAPDLGGLNNSIESLLYCKRAGVGAYFGGSANETDQSTRVTAQVGLGCSADLLIGKPGQGVDEAIMIQRNEMKRTLTLIDYRARR